MRASRAQAGPTTAGRLGRFWLPLQATWLMMAVEGPFLAAVVARLPDPTFNLAAYGVAFSLAIVLEAPVIMMMTASTALADSRGNLQRLRRFTALLNLGITVLALVLLSPPVWELAVLGWMALDPEVARLTWTALVILLPWPAAIGYRRFYQGLLIRVGLTRRVAWGTLVRVSTMGLTATLLWQASDLPGAWVGAAALSAGVVAEALAARLMAAPALALLCAREEGRLLGYGEITRFYAPLALTSTISLAVHPMVTFFLGQSRYGLESLAVMPVVTALVFLFRTPGLSFQEVAVTALSEHPANRPVAARFALWLGLAASAGLALVALTPLAGLWLEQVSGLSPELAGFAWLPVALLVPLPALSVLLSWQRARVVVARRTGPVTWASALEVLGILTVLLLTTRFWDLPGATAAAIAFLVGRLMANGLLFRADARSALSAGR